MKDAQGQELVSNLCCSTYILSSENSLLCSQFKKRENEIVSEL